MATSEVKQFVDSLRTEWKVLWRERIDDRVRAEGMANQDYSRLFVERGTVIVATRDYKPLDFHEILQKHVSPETANRVAPNPTEGGWGKFVRTTLPQPRRESRRTAPPAPRTRPPTQQQRKKGGRGWLHFTMD